jgi:uncharacterized protein GlcG (DUF336 family)
MKMSLLSAPALGAIAIAVIAVENPSHAQQAAAQPSNHCADLPSAGKLRAALTANVDVAKSNPAKNNGGLGNNMWASIVDRDGVVCAVVFTGQRRGDQWPGSRVISAQKANTANAFSLDGFALSTANLFAAVQPGGSLFGLQESNPVDTEVAYGGDSNTIGSDHDPMVGGKIGGINVFGGGLALYTAGHKIIGALGVSGDTSCADHNVAWRVRDALKLDNVPAGVNPNGNDGIIYDNDSPPVPAGALHTSGAPVVNFHSASGFGHPLCGFGEETFLVAAGGSGVDLTN